MIHAIRFVRRGFDCTHLPVCVSIGNLLPIPAATEAAGPACSAGLLQDFAVNAGIVFG